MNLSISLKTKVEGIASRIKVEKKGITKVLGDGLIKSVKLAIPDPKKVPSVKGKDRAQIVIKVDGKPVLNQKITGIKADLGLVALVNNMIK